MSKRANLKHKIKRLRVLQPPMPWHRPQVKATENDAVILLHGLWRSVQAMNPMANHLHAQGYHTINIPYPSFRKPMDELTSEVESIILKNAGDRRLHFVTHSLGGIITRNLLSRLPVEQTGNLVMLAPPNQGSEIIDWLSNCKPIGATLGPAGKSLATNSLPNSTPPIPDHVPTAVIMGKRSVIPFFRTFLDDDNDGIVSVEKGRVDGMNEFHVLDADHTFIASYPKTMAMTYEFIKNGKTKAN